LPSSNGTHPATIAKSTIAALQISGVDLPLDDLRLQLAEPEAESEVDHPDTAAVDEQNLLALQRLFLTLANRCVNELSHVQSLLEQKIVSSH
jgi:hypothetical protein